MYEDFKSDFKGTSAFERLSELKLDVKYTKVPTLTVDHQGRLALNVALMPFLMQINYSYLFFQKIKDEDSRMYEIRQKMIPLIAFQRDPVTTSIAGLPVLYGLDRSEVEYAKLLSMNQMYFMMLHEIGHVENGHIPGRQPNLKINSAEGSKEIEADIYAYCAMEKLDGLRRMDMVASIVALLSFYKLVEELENKLCNREVSPAHTVFKNRLHLAKMSMRKLVSDFGSDTIDKTSFDAVEEASIQYMMYSLHPLGVVQQTFKGMSVDELQELCNRYTDENITKYLEENKDAADNN